MVKRFRILMADEVEAMLRGDVRPADEIMSGPEAAKENKAESSDSKPV